MASNLKLFLASKFQYFGSFSVSVNAGRMWVPVTDVVVLVSKFQL